MAGDFVMIQCATPRKPEVLRLADLLSVEPAHAFGLCVIAWMWFDEQTEDGRAFGATDTMLDAVVGRQGFTNALVDVGWLRVREGALEAPNFDRHMGDSAKKRAKNTRRQRKRRRAPVAPLSHNQRDKSATKEEKRREEISNTPTPFTKPTVDQVREYCLERKNGIDPQQFVDHYTANGWKVGKNSMKDWRASVRTWERNSIRQPESKAGQPLSIDELADWNPIDGGGN